jgi:plasmid maintenance system antidote protein VapI
MPAKSFSEQLREAVLRCGETRYRISKDTGITEAQLSRFVNGHADLSLPTIDKLTEYIGARLTLQRATRKANKRKRKKVSKYGKSGKNKG